MDVPDNTGIISQLGIQAVPEAQHPPSQQSVEEEKSLLGRVRGVLAKPSTVTVCVSARQFLERLYSPLSYNHPPFQFH
jgi:hypothetical protein